MTSLRSRFVRAAVFCVAVFEFTGAAGAAESPTEIFEKFWIEAKSNIYTAERAEIFFTDEAYYDLLERAEAARTLYDLTPIINRFLETLGVSHTHFYDDTTIEYYFFRSLFSTRELDSPTVNHIGAQFTTKNGRYVVREVFDGYPAAVAGIKRGDEIITADGEAFHPYQSFNSRPRGADVKLVVRRGGATRTVFVRPVDECPHLSLYKAMLNSKRVVATGAFRIGYIHLWTGTNGRILEAFKEAVENELADCDAMILDIRGGFGGAWYDYLDPFFPDRSGYFRSTWIERDGEREEHGADAKANPSYYGGPLVVLIDGGTRSGKEALAYQFRKAGRATLIGENTSGAFTAGRGVFTEVDAPYILYLAVAEILLDGNQVEGVGIAPDIEVPYPLDAAPESDPQLERALEELERRLRQ